MLSFGLLAQTTFYTQTSGDPNDVNNWNSDQDGNGFSPSDFTLGDVFIILGGHTMVTTSGGWSISGTGSSLQIGPGGELRSDFPVVLSAQTSFEMDNGTIYRHNNTGSLSTIFQGIINLQPGSIVEINKSDGTFPSGISFGNLVINLQQDPGQDIIYQNGGSISIAETLTIQNTQGRQFRIESDAAFTLDIGGDLVIAGGTFNANAGSASSVNYIINLDGNFDQSGGTFEHNNSASPLRLNFNGSDAQFSQSSGTFSTTNMNFVVGSGATLTLNDDLPVSSSRTFTQSGTLNTGNSAITGGGTYIMGAGTTISTDNPDGLEGAVNCGSVTFSSSGNYEFNGSSSQVTGSFTTSPTANTVNNLIINNGVGVDLTNDLTVAGTLNLTSGKLILGSSSLTVADLAGVPSWGSSTSNYIIADNSGSFTRSAGTGPYLYPIGTTSSYMPCRLSTSDLSVNISSTNNLPNPTLGLKKQWNIEGSGSNLDFDFQWPQSEEGSGISSRTHLYLYRKDADWTQSLEFEAASGTNPYTISFTGVDCCSGFTMGEEGALPVELIEFVAYKDQRTVKLNWTTASERDNDKFIVERSADAKNYSTLTEIKGAGNSTSLKNYTYTDHTPIKGINYYRLKQQDFDGKFVYSNVRVVEFEDGNMVSLFPTLVKNNLNIKTNAISDLDTNIQIISLSNVMILSNEVIIAGEDNKDLDISNLPSGSYIARIVNGQQVQTQKFMKQ